MSAKLRSLALPFYLEIHFWQSNLLAAQIADADRIHAATSRRTVDGQCFAFASYRYS